MPLFNASATLCPLRDVPVKLAPSPKSWPLHADGHGMGTGTIGSDNQFVGESTVAVTPGYRRVDIPRSS